MKKKITSLLVALSLIMGFSLITAPAASAYSTGSCHVRLSSAGNYYWIEWRNYSAWEEWTDPYVKDGYWVKRVNSYYSNYFTSYSWPTWGTWIRSC